ncbi:hypothetical protein [Bordetella sp. 2513F-2]
MNPLFLLLAQDAGLQEIATDFQEDLYAAVQSAVQLRNALFTLDDVTAEPWPPMQARGQA